LEINEMSDLSFAEELIKAAVAGVVPTAVLAFGGRWLLDKYDARKKEREHELHVVQKRREQEIELVRFVRQRQYDALQELYKLFAQYMECFRLVNSGLIDLADPMRRLRLLKRIAAAEGRVDAVILRIASEFAHEDIPTLGDSLANLRQSVQVWRRCVCDGERLPFRSSEQRDYMRFKKAFTEVCTHLVSIIYQRLDPATVAVEKATGVLTYVFDNRHEWHDARELSTGAAGA
jgi:hypothetical protein